MNKQPLLLHKLAVSGATHATRHSAQPLLRLHSPNDSPGTSARVSPRVCPAQLTCLSPPHLLDPFAYMHLIFTNITELWPHLVFMTSAKLWYCVRALYRPCRPQLALCSRSDTIVCTMTTLTSRFNARS